ncbi:MAG: trypsin-like serine protease [Rhodoferax sp.]|uniref:trypsin-like serine protease n=1 Tax=Rhodoferax sp. TaxID=50421 RepID=UPI002715926D|nr:trypsin-like serine protease [Rhodoferax sp.]MDO8447180.1 trypsin-like serine protease [Rhodoferax sp.]
MSARDTMSLIGRYRAWCALVGTLVAPLSAFALVGGAGVAPNVADSPWSGVGSLSVGASKFTGTLIAPGYVLTAAHVVAGADLSEISFQVNAGTSYAMSASQVFVNPAYTGSSNGNFQGDPTNHGDLAIIKLSSAVSADVPVYNLYTGNLQSRDLTFVSYAGSTTSKRTGENIADVLFADAAGTKHVYLFDYDGPDLSTNRLGANIAPNGTLGADREASLVGGDSGSAAFIDVHGQWQLAGINTFEAKFSSGPATSGQYGTGGGGIVLSAYSSWINSVVMTPVPEPETFAMMLAGLGLIGGIGRRRMEGRSDRFLAPSHCCTRNSP